MSTNIEQQLRAEIENVWLMLATERHGNATRLKDLRDELTLTKQKLEAITASLKAVCDNVDARFHGYDIDKLPEILISLSAKLFDNGGVFWEVTIDQMPAMVQGLKERLEAAEQARQFALDIADSRRKSLEAAQLHIKELRTALESAPVFFSHHEFDGDKLAWIQRSNELLAKQPDTRALDKALLEAEIEVLEKLQRVRTQSIVERRNYETTTMYCAISVPGRAGTGDEAVWHHRR